jgi:transketolase
VTPNYNEGDKISTRKAYGNGLLKAREADARVVALDGDTKVSTFAVTMGDKFPESFI